MSSFEQPIDPTAASASSDNSSQASASDNMGASASIQPKTPRMHSLSDPVVKEKRIRQIERLLNTQPVDLDALHTVSRLEGGFINNELRQRVWPKFLGVNRYMAGEFRTESGDRAITRKIRCDVERSFWNFSHCKDWDEAKLQEKRVLLTDLITACLEHNPGLQYYQGFHDVATVFIEVFEDDADLCYLLIEAVSRHFMRDFMGADFHVVTDALSLILQIVKKVDVKLFAFLSKSLTEPYFAVSWLITWFSHDLKDLNTVVRIYDALITSHPMFCLYMCTALVLSCKDDIFAMDCEMSQIHNFLVNVCERKKVSFDKIIVKADSLMSALPPSRLKVLGSKELRELIARKKVAMFLKPPCITRYCDTDAFMLEEFKRKKDEAVAKRARDMDMELAENASAEDAAVGLGDTHALYWLSSALLGGIVNLVGAKKEDPPNST